MSYHKKGIPKHAKQSGVVKICYKVQLSKTAEKSFNKFPQIIRDRFQRIFNEIQRWGFLSQHDVKRIKSNKGILFRLRDGDYRMIFEKRNLKEDNLTYIIIYVIKIGHRDKFY